jgi:hypothetical protein
VAIPFGHELPYDLIVVRKEDGALERVQCKYTTSNGRVVVARVMSNSAWVTHRYTKDEVDWIAVYDATTDKCFYVPSAIWDRQMAVSLRLVPTVNGQSKGIRRAHDFRLIGGDPRIDTSPSPSQRVPLPLTFLPE